MRPPKASDGLAEEKEAQSAIQPMHHFAVGLVVFVGEHGGKSLVYTDTQTHAPNQEHTYAHTNPTTNAFTQTRMHTHTRVRECVHMFVSVIVCSSVIGCFSSCKKIYTLTHIRMHTHTINY